MEIIWAKKLGYLYILKLQKEKVKNNAYNKNIFLNIFKNDFKTYSERFSKSTNKDSMALFEKRRYHTSFYIAGYAIEMALKYKICKMYFFTKGFPETPVELQQYYKQIKTKGVRAIISKIHEIKHHDFAKLLLYSGEEYNIKKNHFNEWLIALQWSPEMRYKHLIIKKTIAHNNLKAITILLKSIL